MRGGWRASLPLVLQLGLVAFLRAEFGDKEGVPRALHAARHGADDVFAKAPATVSGSAGYRQGSVAKLAEVKGCRAGFYLYGPEYKQWHRDYPDENPGKWTPEHVCCGHKPGQQCEPLLQPKDIDEFSRLESMRVAIAREEKRWTEIRMQYMAAATAAGAQGAIKAAPFRR